MNMKRKFFLALAIVVFQNSPAQFLVSETDSRASALGGAFVALINNSSAVFGNPSGLGKLKNRHLSLYIEPHFFGVKEISTAAITYAEAFRFGTFGIGARTFGFDLYRESKAVLSFGRSFSDRIHWGVGLALFHVSVLRYGSALSMGFDAGILAELTDDLTWGVVVRNLSGAKIGESGQKISRTYNTGLRFEPAEGASFLVDIEKEPDRMMNVKLGAEVMPFSNIALRAGINSEPVSYSAGFGLVYGIFGLDYAATVIEPMGLSNKFNLSLLFQ
jgi:hypothetical protein